MDSKPKNMVGAAMTSNPAFENTIFARGMCIASVTSNIRLIPSISNILEENNAFSKVFSDVPSIHLTYVITD